MTSRNSIIDRSHCISSTTTATTRPANVSPACTYTSLVTARRVLLSSLSAKICFSLSVPLPAYTSTSVCYAPTSISRQHPRYLYWTRI